MRKTLIRVVALCTTVLLYSGCQTGYQQENGEWYWVTYDEGFGRRARPLDVDSSTFVVLNDHYAKDQHAVFFDGSVIAGATSGTFELIKGPYAKDHRRVYLLMFEVFGADPQSFEVLGFPYARDGKEVYNGTVPMGVRRPHAFKVLRKARGYRITSVKYLSQTPGLADSLIARGMQPDDRVLIGSSLNGTGGVARVGNTRYEGAMAVGGEPAPSTRH